MYSKIPSGVDTANETGGSSDSDRDLYIIRGNVLRTTTPKNYHNR